MRTLLLRLTLACSLVALAGCASSVHITSAKATPGTEPGTLQVNVAVHYDFSRPANGVVRLAFDENSGRMKIAASKEVAAGSGDVELVAAVRTNGQSRLVPRVALWEYPTEQYSHPLAEDRTVITTVSISGSKASTSTTTTPASQ